MQAQEAIFPKGEKGSKALFTGNAYPTPLVDADSKTALGAGDVTVKFKLQ